MFRSVGCSNRQLLANTLAIATLWGDKMSKYLLSSINAACRPIFLVWDEVIHGSETASVTASLLTWTVQISWITLIWPPVSARLVLLPSLNSHYIQRWWRTSFLPSATPSVQVLFDRTATLTTADHSALMNHLGKQAGRSGPALSWLISHQSDKMHCVALYLNTPKLTNHLHAVFLSKSYIAATFIFNAKVFWRPWANEKKCLLQWPS